MLRIDPSSKATTGWHRHDIDADPIITISVVIPAYNRANCILPALHSVFAQTYPVHEIVIIDDGSTDNTAEIVADYLANKDSSTCPVRYIKQQNGGAGVARNTGVAAATGKWVAFLDSDDRWLSAKLELQVRTLRIHGLSLGACATDARYVNNPKLQCTAFQAAALRCADEAGVFSDILKRIVYGFHGLYIQTFLVRRDLILNAGGFDPSLRLGEDSDFLFNLARRTNICYVAKPLVEIDRTPHRPNGLIELSRQEIRQLQLYDYLYTKWLRASESIPQNIKSLINRRLQEVQIGWSNWFLANGDWVGARRSLGRAMKYHLSGSTAIRWALAWVFPGLMRSILLYRRARTGAATLR